MRGISWLAAKFTVNFSRRTLLHGEVSVEFLLEVLFFSPSGDIIVHTYMCYIWKISCRPTFITDDRKKYIFGNPVFEEKPETIKHVENNGSRSRTFMSETGRGNEHTKELTLLSEREPPTPPPPPPQFRKLSIRFQKNLRQIHRPLSTCQMDWKLA
jgi:hypothetical protein